MSDILKAEYQGEQVELNKPRRTPKGDSKKFEVFVMDGDKVKRVAFGDPDMEIRRDDDEARASFRARHNCDSQKDKTSAAYWSCRMWEKDTTVSETTKADGPKVGDKVSWNSSGGRASGIIRQVVRDGDVPDIPVKVTGTKDEPAARIEITDDEGNPTGEMVGHKLSTVSKEAQEESTFKVLKIDQEQRIIFGWASVTKVNGELVVDRQGDVIKTETLHKAINDFMKGVRVGKVMHTGERVGDIIHSFPVSKDIMDALGIQTNKEGWIVGYYVEDETTWELVKSGEYTEFSIGGRGHKEDYAP